MLRRDDTLALTAPGLLEGPHPERHDHAGQPDGEERRLPGLQPEGRRGRVREHGVPAVDDRATEEQADTGADVDARGIDGQHRRPPLRGEVVRQHGERGRRGAGFTHADADAVCREGHEAACRARQRGHEAPETETHRDQVLADPYVRHAAERNAEDRIEHGEGGAVEEADIGVRDAEVGFDLLGQDRHDLPIDEIEHVHDDEHTEHVLRIAAADFVIRRHLPLPSRSRRCRLPAGVSPRSGAVRPSAPAWRIPPPACA